jgi:type VI secretion system secreted protein VgrG
MSKKNAYLSVTTPLGKQLTLRAFRGEERISGLFHFVLDFVSGDATLDPKKIVGKSVTIKMTLSDKSTRHISGVVTRFIYAGRDTHEARYHAELRPFLWLLSQTTDCRIFQQKSVPEIVEAVLSELGFKDVKKSLKNTYQKREYCVQYQETGFEFISRLLEDEGIFYFFEHSADKHTLVLADDADAHKPCPGLKAAVIAQDPFKTPDLIARCTYEEQVVSNGYSLTDYNFEIPSTDLFVKTGSGSPKLMVYEHPGGYDKKDKGDKRVKSRIETREQPAKLLRGDGACRSFVSGYKFKLKGHERKDLNADYVLCAVYHSADTERYGNHFVAQPASVPFRPPLYTRRPVIAGTQTALVVGKKGEEIWTDKYGRIKVQFPWDRLGKKDENSSCWVRVAQTWAGKGFGAFFLPRVGQEVVVSFLDGNPDRPLITGAVYNAQQKVPYALPDNQTKSTVKSNTSKGGGGFNELRFEDKKDKEEIFIHAQKDMKTTVKHDLTSSVGNDEKHTVKKSRTVEIQEGDETLVVKKGKRVVKVQKGDETHEVKGTRTLKVEKDEEHSNKAKYTHEVTKDYTLKVKGNLIIDVTGDVTIKSGKSMKQEAKQDISIAAKMNLKQEAGMDMSVKAKMNLKQEAGIMLESKGKAMAKLEGGGMTTIKGGLVKLN